MRTEFALASLGFVSVIVLSSLLSKYGHHDERKKILLDSVSGSVGMGNFTYWKLNEQGPLLLQLTSLAGDADLYVSESERASYEVDRNNFSSTTCGIDTISVPASFPRPIGIGVFGHWSHKKSDYVMNVYLDTDGLEEYIISHIGVTVPDDHAEKGARITNSPLVLGFMYILEIVYEYVPLYTELSLIDFL